MLFVRIFRKSDAARRVNGRYNIAWTGRLRLGIVCTAVAAAAYGPSANAIIQRQLPCRS